MEINAQPLPRQKCNLPNVRHKLTTCLSCNGHRMNNIAFTDAREAAHLHIKGNERIHLSGNLNHQKDVEWTLAFQLVSDFRKLNLIMTT